MPTTLSAKNAPYQTARLNEAGNSLQVLDATVKHYAESFGDTIAHGLTDVLTDLRHLCDARGFDFAALDAAASQCYIDECELREKETGANQS